MKKSKHIEDKYLDKIIRVAYGEGNIFERFSVYYRSGKNPEIKKIFEEYRETAMALEDMKNENCPDELVKKTESNIFGNARISLRIPAIIFSRPVLSTAAAAAAVILFSLIVLETQKPQPQYSGTQVKQAEVQVKETLAIIDRVFQNTRRTIEDDVLKKKVTPPIREGVNVVNNLFKGG